MRNLFAFIALVILFNLNAQETLIIGFDCSKRILEIDEPTDFTDTTLNNPESWEWTFEGGTPGTSNEQNPSGITYSNPGIYSVTLSATNGAGTITLTKTDYIIVTEIWVNEFCDTINNINEDPLTCQALSSNWGYLPGHNGLYVTAYADKFENYMFSQINSLLVPVAKAYSGGGKVKFSIWDGDETPNNKLGEKEIFVSGFIPGLFNIVEFNSPIPVYGNFFIGYELSYAYPDTFAIYMAADRGPTGINTMYYKKDGQWYEAPEYLDIHTSLSIIVRGCLLETEIEGTVLKDINLYPNPSSGRIFLDISKIHSNKINVKVEDLLGNEIKTQVSCNNSTLEINLEDEPSGIYFINLVIDEQLITKKVIITR